MASLPELITSVKRHYNNNFRDPFRQSMINLFLGVFKPGRSLIEQNGVDQVIGLDEIPNAIVEHFIVESNN